MVSPREKLKQRSPQENWWAGLAGVEYQRGGGKVNRHNNPQLFFRRVFGQDMKSAVGSVIEFGCHDGRNLKALREMGIEDLTGVEINPIVARSIPGYVDVRVESILEFDRARQYELAFTKGLLIHIHPQEIERALAVLHDASSRYILMAEYYATRFETDDHINEHRQSITWSGPYVDIMLKLFPALEVIDYGLLWRGDKELPMENVTWFLVEK